MIKEICRLIKKGKNDSIINKKIFEFKKNDFDKKNVIIKAEYLNTIFELSRPALEEDYKTELDNKKLDQELNNPWLVELDEFNDIKLPTFEMTDDEIQDYRKQNAIEFRKANFEALIGEQLESIYDSLKDGDTDLKVFYNLNLKVKNRFPKVGE